MLVQAPARRCCCAIIGPVGERSFLILHGLAYDGDPDHWHARLAGSLRDRGGAVAYPSLPDPESPSLERWLRIVRDELSGAAGGVIVICHSLSVLLWLHLAPGLDRPVDRLLLVAPPEDREVPAGGGEFRSGAADPPSLRSSSRSTPRVVRGTLDPYSPSGIPAWAAAAGCEVDEIPGAGHINPDDGHGPWPFCERWCDDPAVRIEG